MNEGNIRSAKQISLGIGIELSKARKIPICDFLAKTRLLLFLLLLFPETVHFLYVETVHFLYRNCTFSSVFPTLASALIEVEKGSSTSLSLCKQSQEQSKETNMSLLFEVLMENIMLEEKKKKKCISIGEYLAVFYHSMHRANVWYQSYFWSE